MLKSEFLDSGGGDEKRKKKKDVDATSVSSNHPLLEVGMNKLNTTAADGVIWKPEKSNNMEPTSGVHDSVNLNVNEGLRNVNPDQTVGNETCPQSGLELVMIGIITDNMNASSGGSAIKSRCYELH